MNRHGYILIFQHPDDWSMPVATFTSQSIADRYRDELVARCPGLGEALDLEAVPLDPVIDRQNIPYWHVTFEIEQHRITIEDIHVLTLGDVETAIDGPFEIEKVFGPDSLGVDLVLNTVRLCAVNESRARLKATAMIIAARNEQRERQGVSES